MTINNLLKTTRQYFWDLGFDEVEIPYLNSALPLEPNIYAFETIWTHSQARYYLPTSPEFALKKHLAATKSDCFSISHCFRDLEAEGPHHTKEFMMLEWYEIGKSYLDLMESVKKYLLSFNKNFKFKIINLPSNLPDNEPDFNQYFLNEIEPNLPESPVFVTGYPAFLSPLAETGNCEPNNFSARSERLQGPKVASTAKIDLASDKKNLRSERFELYINRIEIANGCTENRDPVSIKSAFEVERQYRLKNNLPLHPYSQDFIDFSAKLPPCSGVGLGIDRLVTLINHKTAL